MNPVLKTREHRLLELRPIFTSLLCCGFWGVLVWGLCVCERESV